MHVRDKYIATCIVGQVLQQLLKPQGAQVSLSAAGCPRVGAEDAVVIRVPVVSWELVVLRYDVANRSIHGLNFLATKYAS